MGTVDTVLALAPEWQWLAAQARNVTSQYGEDGVIAAFFLRFGVTNLWCYEVGAHDGHYLSNTLALRDIGWNAALIEKEASHYEELRKYESKTVRCVREEIAPDSFDSILDRCGCPESPDLGIIDIDGDEYWIFKAMRNRPRLAVVEFANGHEDFCPRNPGDRQAGINPLAGLARDRGYVPVVKSHVNLFLVDKCLIPKQSG